MLRPAKMQKIRIVGLNNILSTLIKDLHEAGIVEIKVIDYSAMGLEGGRPLDIFNTISERLMRIRAIKTMLKPVNGVNGGIKEQMQEGVDFEREEKNLAELERTLKALTEERITLERDLTRLENELKTVKWLEVFDDIDFSKLETNTLSYLVGELPVKQLEKCRKKIEEITKYYDMRTEATAKNSEKLRCLIIYKKGDYDISDELSECGFSKISVPQNVTSPTASKMAILKELEEKKRRIKELDATLEALSKQHYQKIISLEKALSIEAERAEIAARFNFSKKTFILEGWIKANDFVKLKSIVEKYKERAIIETVEISEHEIPPTVLENPAYANQFQFITEKFSLPNSLELDPTMIYFITLPLFYGMIVGDVAYGLISFILARWFLKNFKNEMLVNASKIWLASAVPAIFFGIVFDEWFGVSHFYWIKVINEWLRLVGLAILIERPLYSGLSRIENLTDLMAITVVLALLHLALGFILGAINEFEHNKKHAIGKLSWIGIEVGGALTIATFLFHAFPMFIGSGAIVLLGVSIIVLALTEGFVGIIEIPGLLGNVLSYTRIALVGVAGVMLAEVINMFFTPIPSHGIFALLMFPLLIILHSVNAFIAMFEALIQGGRLNIVEFRSKFLHGGGKLFEPFALR
jgi:V/A-type H+-transporting ATPase subunit I